MAIDYVVYWVLCTEYWDILRYALRNYSMIIDNNINNPSNNVSMRN